MTKNLDNRINNLSKELDTLLNNPVNDPSLSEKLKSLNDQVDKYLGTDTGKRPEKVKKKNSLTTSTGDIIPEKLANNINSISQKKALEVATTIKSIQEAEVVEKNAENFGSFFMAIGSIVWFIIDNKECFGIKGDTDVFKIIIYTMFSLSAISTLVSSWFNIVKVKIEDKNHIISKSILIVMFMMAKILFFIMWALSISYNTDTENTNTSTVECKNEFKIVLWLFIGLVILYSGFSWIYFRDSAAGNIANLFAGG